MKDIEIIKVLKEYFDRKFFIKTGSLLDLVPNQLYFIRSKSYLKFIFDASNVHNIHIVAPKEFRSVGINNEHIRFYYVDDVDYVFGELHNYINKNIYGEQIEIDPTSIVHETVLTPEGIRLYHTPDGYKKQLKHISNVVIQSNSRVGAYTIIHRGVFNPTIIGNYVTIGNTVNIGHNCHVDDHTVITPGCVLAGRVKIGKNCWIGINSSIKHGVEICDNVVIGQHSNVRHSILESGIYAGEPLRKISEYTNNWNF